MGYLIDLFPLFRLPASRTVRQLLFIWQALLLMGVAIVNALRRDSRRYKAVWCAFVCNNTKRHSPLFDSLQHFHDMEVLCSAFVGQFVSLYFVFENHRLFEQVF